MFTRHALAAIKLTTLLLALASIPTASALWSGTYRFNNVDLEAVPASPSNADNIIINGVSFSWIPVNSYINGGGLSWAGYTIKRFYDYHNYKWLYLYQDLGGQQYVGTAVWQSSSSPTFITAFNKNPDATRCMGDPIDTGTGRQFQNIPLIHNPENSLLDINYSIDFARNESTCNFDQYFIKVGTNLEFYEGTQRIAKFIGAGTQYTPDVEASRTFKGKIIETGSVLRFLSGGEEKQYTLTSAKYILTSRTKNGQTITKSGSKFIDSATGDWINLILYPTLGSFSSSAGGYSTVNGNSLNDASGINLKAVRTGDSTVFSVNNVTLYTDILVGGKVTQQTDALGHNSYFNYSFGATQLTTYTDRRNNNWLSEFDNANLVGKQSPLGNIIEYTYDSNNRKITETDENTQTTQFGYGTYGETTSITDPKGNFALFGYNSDLYLTSYQDREGNVTSLTRDSNNLVTLTTKPLSQTTAATYNTNRQPLTITNESGNTTTLGYTSGRNTLVTFPSTKTIGYGYNSSGLKSTGTIGGFTTNYNTYDGMGRLTKVTSPRGGITQATYNFRSQVTSSTDPLNQVSSVTYNGNGYPTVATNPDSSTTQFGYDAEDNQTSQTDELGNISTATYDNDNRLTGETDADGVSYSIVLSPTGKVLQVKNDAGQTISTATYDANDNLATIADASSNTTTLAYDKEDRVTGITRPDTKQTTITRDALGRPTTVSRFGRVANTAYTPTGKVSTISLASPSATPITLGYDVDDAQTSETTALGKVVSQQLNSRWLPSQINNNGLVTNLTYDADGNIDTASDSVGTITYTTDLLGRITGTSEVRSGGTNTSSTSYNWRNEPTSYTDWNGATVGYEYNVRGDKTKVTYPGNKQVIYTYTAACRLQTVTDWNSNVTTYTYDGEGRLTTKARPNGITESRSYDLNNRVTQIKELQGSTIITSLDIEYNSIGKITKETYFPAPAGTLDSSSNPTTILEKVYSYLDTGELAGVSANGSVFTYTSDSRANPTNLGIVSNQTWLSNWSDTITVNGDNEATSWNGTAITRNAQGTMLSGPTGLTNSSVTNKSFTVNARQQITDNGRTYDSRGELAGQTGITYLVDAYGDRLTKTDTTGTSYYIYGDGLEYAITPSGNEYYHYDNRGSVTAKTDGAGTITGAWVYEPFGVILASTGTSDFLFLGKFGCATESDLGVYKLGARYYAPNLRQFMSIDSVIGSGSEPNSLNRYVYCMGDPVNFIDPSGLCPNALTEYGEIATGAFFGAIKGNRDGLGGLVAGATGGYWTGAFGSDVDSSNYRIGIYGGGIAGGAVSAAGGELIGIGAVKLISFLGRESLAIINAGRLPWAAEAGAIGTGTYRDTFFAANPTLKGLVWVHHAIEQQVLRKYPGLFTRAELNALSNLRGIPKAINNKLHLSTMRKEWNAFYNANPAATRAQIEAQASTIDIKYGTQFAP